MAAPGSVVGPGIIPAHAGFTGRPGRARRSSRDHPRTRGVYPWAAAMASRRVGSSPHTRGLRLVRKGVLVRVGIIPAHAGFTGSTRSGLQVHGDHPRTRGVYSQTETGARMAPGSSPHTRGLPPGGRAPGARHGIIPAHAGFTSSRSPGVCRCPDHPRTRGVYQQAQVGDEGKIGSSPHTRGLLQGGAVQGLAPRIIPAHAGFTPPAWRPTWPRPDHPRTRGVYWVVGVATGAWAGSSPHTRGLLLVAEEDVGARGIIPAHAGFTRWAGRGGR